MIVGIKKASNHFVQFFRLLSKKYSYICCDGVNIFKIVIYQAFGQFCITLLMLIVVNIELTKYCESCNLAFEKNFKQTLILSIFKQLPWTFTRNILARRRHKEFCVMQYMHNYMQFY